MKILLPVIIFLTFILFPTAILAQSNTFDVTFTYDITDKQAVNGDILSNSDTGLIRSATPFDPKIFGVLQSEPVIVYRPVESSQSAIARAGVVKVNVTNMNGEIKKGDYITSSSLAGKGQKSTQSGYSLGIALEDFTGTNGDKVNYENKEYTSGQILIALKVEYSELSNPRSVLRIFDLFNNALFQNFQDPNRFIEVIKYLAALIVLLASIGMGFLVFARTIPKSVEAMGRNPLAKNAIQFSIIISVILTVFTALIGIAAAFIILHI